MIRLTELSFLMVSCFSPVFMMMVDSMEFLSGFNVICKILLILSVEVMHLLY